MIRKQLLILCLSFSVVSSFAQVTVEGRVTERGESFPFVTVLLLRPDSTLVKGVVTESDGKFTFEKVMPDQYRISASMVGYGKFVSPVITVGDVNVLLADIILDEATTELNEVVVSAQKQFVEQTTDRTIINVQGSVTSAGNSILEVLQKSPGVVVNSQSNSITMNGKSGVRIMINGKTVQAPLDVVLQMLDGMNSSNVERIELIPTPPAKYDAEGNAGIIHIVTKENADLGTNGSIGFTLGYRAFETYGGNFSVNVRRKRFAWLVDYSGLRNHNVHSMKMNRQSLADGFVRTVDDQSDRENLTVQHNLSSVLEWRLSDNTILNVGFTGYRRKWTLAALSTDENHVSSDSAVFTNMNVVESNIWQSATGGVGLQRKINSKSEISISADYLYYHNDNPSTYDNDVFYEQQRMNESSKIDLKKNTPIHILVARADYIFTFSPNFALELGIKGVATKLDNDVLVQRRVEDIWTIDTNLTSLSDLREKIGAAYISTQWNPGAQWNINSGLRYEYSHTTISSPDVKNIVNRKFGYFFPSLSVKRDIGPEKNIQLSYSRRITRPTYNDMAPYVFFWGPNTFSGGNTSLLPAVADAVKGGLQVKQWIISLQFTHAKNEINSYQPEVDKESNSLTYRSQNLSYLNTLGLTNSYSFNITPWWEVQSNITAQYQTARASHQQHDATFHLYGMNVNLMNLLRLPHNITIEITGIYQSKTLTGITSYLPLGSLNAGVSKKLGQRGTLRLSMDDILYTNYWRIKSYSALSGVESYFKYDFHNQYVRLTFTQTLGNTKVKSTKSRSGSEEERRRMGD